jgi:hypothetical protein
MSSEGYSGGVCIIYAALAFEPAPIQVGKFWGFYELIAQHVGVRRVLDSKTREERWDKIGTSIL